MFCLVPNSKCLVCTFLKDIWVEHLDLDVLSKQFHLQKVIRNDSWFRYVYVRWTFQQGLLFKTIRPLEIFLDHCINWSLSHPKNNDDFPLETTRLESHFLFWKSSSRLTKMLQKSSYKILGNIKNSYVLSSILWRKAFITGISFKNMQKCFMNWNLGHARHLHISCLLHYQNCLVSIWEIYY